MKKISAPRAVSIIERISYYGGLWPGIFFLAAIVILVTLEVILRYIFNTSTLLADEYSAYFFVGLLYWGGMSFWRQVDDPWTDPKTLDRREGREQPLFNGEGTIVYPGRAAGYDGIAASLRLKALRDAVEDYEYLAILERAGRADEAQKIVLPLAGSWFEWEPDPAAYQRARAALAELIVAARANTQ